MRGLPRRPRDSENRVLAHEIALIDWVVLLGIIKQLEFFCT
jgi:hypothetical protein